MRWRAPRWWAHARASVGGYFWLPCPLCGEMFAGYEWADGATIQDPDYPSNPSRGIGVCVRCIDRPEVFAYNVAQAKTWLNYHRRSALVALHEHHHRRGL